MKNNRLFWIGCLMGLFVLLGCEAEVPLTEAERAALAPSAGIQIDGSADAPVQIVEFGDFGCHACENWHKAGVKEQLKAQFGDQIAFQFRHFAVITQASPKAAEAAQCAAEQDKFWEYHDALYERKEYNALGVKKLKSYASDIGLDQDEFDICLDNDVYTDYIQNEIRTANQLGARGTPTFLVNGTISSANPQQLATAIQTALSR